MYPGPSSPTNRGEESNSDVCTPPLVFTPHFVGAQPQYAENAGTPPMQPLQVFTNFNAYGSGTSMPRRESGQLYEAENSPIRVMARTRDGRHSPYLAGNPNAGQMELESQGPYGFSYSGTSTPVAVSTPNTRLPVPNFGQVPADDSYRGDDGGHGAQLHAQCNQYYMGAGGHAYNTGASQPGMQHNAMSMQQQQQQRTVVTEKVYSHSSLDPAFELPAQVVHRALKGRCRFIAFPANLPAPSASSGGANAGSHDDNGVALFIGQVRFETTPAELTWLVQRTCGAVTSRLEGRGAGCYLLYCRSETDLQLIRGLHKRVLFDVGGAWLARTPEEVDALCEYVAIDAPLLSKKARLPRDSMVVEDLKVDAVTSSHRAGGGNDTSGQPSHNGGGKKSGHGHSGSGQAARGGSQNAGSDANTASRQQPPQHQQTHNTPYWQGGSGGSHPTTAPPPDYGSSVGSGPSPPPYNPY